MPALRSPGSWAQLGVCGEASVPSSIQVNSISPVSASQARWKIPLRSKWKLNPVFLPKRSHGQRRPASYHPKCHRVRHDRVVTHAQVKVHICF